MKRAYLSDKTISVFRDYLEEGEKSTATIDKYIHDVRAFFQYCGECRITKEILVEYKQHLLSRGYAVRSVNSIIASLNSLLSFLGQGELRLKSLKIQQQMFCPEEKELTKAEYERLCRAAERKHNERLSLIIQTICGTGIRVSELPFITVEAVEKGKTEVSLKGKNRCVFIVQNLRKKLLRYIAQLKIKNRSCLCYPNGQSNKQNLYLARNESFMCRSKS